MRVWFYLDGEIEAVDDWTYNDELAELFPNVIYFYAGFELIPMED